MRRFLMRIRGAAPNHPIDSFLKTMRAARATLPAHPARSIRHFLWRIEDAAIDNPVISIIYYRCLTIFYRLQSRPFAVSSFVLFCTWLAYRDLVRGDGRRIDTSILAAIAVVSTEVVLVMLIWTNRWRLLAIGLLYFFTATALLYYRTSTALHGDPWFQGSNWLALIRSLFFLGACYTAIGVTNWAARHRSKAFPWFRRNGLSETIDPTAEVMKDVTH